MPWVKWQCGTCSPCEQHQAGPDQQQEGQATRALALGRTQGSLIAASLEVKQHWKQHKQGIYQSERCHSGIVFLNTVLWDHLQPCQRGGRNIFTKAQAQLPVAAPWEGPWPPGAALNMGQSNTPGPPATEDSVHDRPVSIGGTLKMSLPQTADDMSNFEQRHNLP